MTAVVIEGVPPWDGRYEFDDFAFTNRELFRIKQLSGLRAGELIEALEANDTSAYVGVAMVVLERSGLKLEADDLWGAKVGSITLDLSGGVADPPTTPAVEGVPSGTAGSSGSGSGSGGV
jgi:hypothetical protein